jgi:osmotically-inducible protein OsmY
MGSAVSGGQSSFAFMGGRPLMFTASEQALSNKAKTALESCGQYALRQLVVEETARGLVISGQVTSFYQKQQAQEIVRSVVGDVVLINHIEVV